MRKSECNRQRPRVRARARNGEISLFQRFLKMGASTADCIWRIVESMPELRVERSGPSSQPRSQVRGFAKNPYLDGPSLVADAVLNPIGEKYASDRCGRWHDRVCCPEGFNGKKA